MESESRHSRGHRQTSVSSDRSFGPKTPWLHARRQNPPPQLRLLGLSRHLPEQTGAGRAVSAAGFRGTAGETAGLLRHPLLTAYQPSLCRMRYKGFGGWLWISPAAYWLPSNIPLRLLSNGGQHVAGSDRGRHITSSHKGTKRDIRRRPAESRL
jgi:hypothetical protein